MKKIYLISLAALLSTQAMAVEQDSVYTWGEWAEGIQPAAGPVARVTPPPAQTPNVNFRPNENSAFLREAALTQRIPAAPVSGAPQISGISVTTISTPAIPSTSLNTGGAFKSQ